MLSLHGLEGDLRKDDTTTENYDRNYEETTKKTTEKKINKTREIILDAINNNPSLTNNNSSLIF